MGTIGFIVCLVILGLFFLVMTISLLRRAAPATVAPAAATPAAPAPVAQTNSVQVPGGHVIVPVAPPAGCVIQTYEESRYQKVSTLLGLLVTVLVVGMAALIFLVLVPLLTTTSMPVPVPVVAPAPHCESDHPTPVVAPAPAPPPQVVYVQVPTPPVPVPVPVVAPAPLVAACQVYVDLCVQQRLRDPIRVADPYECCRRAVEPVRLRGDCR